MIPPAIASLLEMAIVASERDDHERAASALHDAHALFREMRDDQRLIPPDRSETLDAVYATAKALARSLDDRARAVLAAATRVRLQHRAELRHTAWQARADAHALLVAADVALRRCPDLHHLVPTAVVDRLRSLVAAGTRSGLSPRDYLASGDGPVDEYVRLRAELGTVDDRRAARVVIELADEWRCDGDASSHAFAVGIARELWTRDDDGGDDEVVSVTSPAPPPAPPADEAGELDLAVQAISQLLSARAFDQLLWHIDRDGFDVSSAQLVAQFVRDAPHGGPELLATWWPFPPGSRRVSHVRVGDVALLELVQEIPQGDGMVLRRLTWAWFRWSKSGWRACAFLPPRI